MKRKKIKTESESAVIVFLGGFDESNTFGCQRKNLTWEEEALKGKKTHTQRFPCCMDSIINPHIGISFRKPFVLSLFGSFPNCNRCARSCMKHLLGQVCVARKRIELLHCRSLIPRVFLVAEVSRIKITLRRLHQRLNMFFPLLPILKLNLSKDVNSERSRKSQKVNETKPRLSSHCFAIFYRVDIHRQSISHLQKN